MRDHFCDETYFKTLLQEIHDVYSDEFKGKGKGDCEDLSDACVEHVACVRVSYAKGDSVRVMNKYYSAFLKHVFYADKVCKATNENEKSILLLKPYFVSSAITFGESLGFTNDKLIKVAEYIPSGKNQLVDILLSHYLPDRKISEVLREKGKYKQLIEILESKDKAFQAKKLKNYLDQWPKKLGIRAPDGIRPLHETPTYDGYWCYEAAAVVIVCGIDDESFRDHEFYPADLMSWRNNDQ